MTKDLRQQLGRTILFTIGTHQNNLVRAILPHGQIMTLNSTTLPSEKKTCLYIPLFGENTVCHDDSITEPVHFTQLVEK